MGLKDRLRSWTHAHYNVDLELYLEAFRDAIVQADRVLQSELEAVLRQAGCQDATELDGLSGEAAYDVLTGIMLDVQDRIARRLPAHSAGTWLYRSRQHVVVDLLAIPPQSDFEVRGRMMGCQLLPRVVTVLGADLPRDSEPDSGFPPATADLVVDVHVVLMLLEWYSHCLLARRRIALGGSLVAEQVIPVDVKLPSSKLPPSLAPMLPRTLLRENQLGAADGLTGMLSGLGLTVPQQWMPLMGSAEVEFLGSAALTRFFVAGVHRVADFQVGTRHLSKVRVFEPIWVEAKEILEPLWFLRQELEKTWQLSPVELVAGAVSLCLLPRDMWSDSARRPEFERTFSTCGIAIVGVAELRRHLEILLPEVTAALGGSLPPSGTGDAVSTILSRFVETPREQPAGPLRMRGPLPFVLLDGDRALIDLYSMNLAFSCVLDSVPFAGSGAQEKGPWFEGEVRRFVLAAHPSIVSRPSLEQEFVLKGKTLGEADVVVGVDDTAFLIECKSRRHNSTDACMTLEEALRRRRDVASWAQQARRTAEYVAAHPVGPRHRVPDDIRWVVPLVCSPILEVDWDPSGASDLIPGEVSMVMRPAEVVALIRGDRWRSTADRAWQARVQR